MNEKIKKCCICGGEVKDIFQLAFEDIVGMADNYTQHIGLCERCGFLFTMNPFSSRLLENRYKNESKFEFDSGDHVRDANVEYMKRCRRIKHFIEECTGTLESIMEAGASSGYNLSLYTNSDRYGIEPSALNCRLAKEKYNIDMFCGSFREYEKVQSNKKYELVFLSMILEHIVDPCAFLNSIKKYNSRYIFIEVPTMDVKNIDEPYGMLCEEHVNLFTFEALNHMLGRLGYGLVDARIEYGFDKGYPAGWPCMDTLWEIGRKQVRFNPMIGADVIIREYLEKSRAALEKVQKVIDEIPSDLPVAIWGTGHHVSMLLKNTNLGTKNIIKFYDSDHRKYKYTIHEKTIEKFNSDDVKSGKIKGIVIGTYIFQEVIGQMIYDKCGNDCKIINLYRK